MGVSKTRAPKKRPRVRVRGDGRVAKQGTQEETGSRHKGRKNKKINLSPSRVKAERTSLPGNGQQELDRHSEMVADEPETARSITF